MLPEHETFGTGIAVTDIELSAIVETAPVGRSRMLVVLMREAASTSRECDADIARVHCWFFQRIADRPYRGPSQVDLRDYDVK
jgi:hypothetical protein